MPRAAVRWSKASHVVLAARSPTCCQGSASAATALAGCGGAFGDGVTVALGTDCNPGSSYTQSQPLMMSLACSYMGLSCAEAWLAVTVNAAQAIGRPTLGRLVPGAAADFVLWDADHYRQVCQQLG